MMKKILSTICMLAVFGMAMAQDVKTYSVYDSNQSGDINIADVTNVVDKVKTNVTSASTQQYVTADDLATLLKSIDARLSAIEAKLGIETNSEDKPTTDSNLLPGKFSVAEGKQVQFTKGNLYWDGTTFKLEATQIASSQGNFQSNKTDTYDPAHVSHFFWTNLTDYQSGNASYMPYAESFACSSQSHSDKFWCCVDSPLTVEGTDGLYCLDGDYFQNSEWYYLVNSRANASSLYKYGVTVTDGSTIATNCLILAPDDYDYVNNTLKSSYTLEEVNALGLVCLPAAGYRINKNLCSSGSQGNYWASTCLYSEGSFDADCVKFNPEVIYANYQYPRDMGISLRLVRNI